MDISIIYFNSLINIFKNGDEHLLYLNAVTTQRNHNYFLVDDEVRCSTTNTIVVYKNTSLSHPPLYVTHC